MSAPEKPAAEGRPKPADVPQWRKDMAEALPDARRRAKERRS